VTLVLSDKDVREIGNVATLVNDIERALRAEAAGPGMVLPERLNLAHDATMLRVMPAILPATGLLGLKLFYGALNTGIRYTVMVCSLLDGEVLALVDAAYLTALRTGATSGVATRHLARPDSRSVGLIGSGLEAETNLAAVCAVRPVETVRVYSRNAARRENFAARMGERLRVRIEPVERPEDAVDGTDIVVVATNTGRGGPPAYLGRWLQPGQHVVSIGSTAMFLREIDVEALVRPDVVVFDARCEQVRDESGDVAALAAEHPQWTCTGLLEDVLRGTVRRRDAQQITMFKSVGTAAQDLVAGHSIYEQALTRGAGLVVPDINEPKQF